MHSPTLFDNLYSATLFHILVRFYFTPHILKILSKNTSYGYEIVTTLLGYGFKDIKEGTIYPLLVRLEKKGIITSEMRPSPLGPSRKYYSITPDGVEYLNEFKTNWKQISQSVNQVFDTEV